MKRVLQISKYMYPFIGGIEQVARDILFSLKGEDVEQKIICFNEDAEDGVYSCRRGQTVSEYVDGVEVIRCGCFAKVASQSLSLSYAKQLKKVMEEFKPDVVIFHYPNPFVARYLLKHAKKHFKLYVYWHLDITKQKLLGRLFKGQNQKLINRADKIIATSGGYISGSPYLSRVSDKCRVISCCIDEERLRVTPEDEAAAIKLRQNFGGKTLCFAFGRHVEYKGYEYLIRAAELLPENFAVVIGGSGPLTPKLKTLAEGNKKVIFTGRLTDGELNAYLIACDIFCFPSVTKNEAFGIALAEAMYHGKPAVTFTIKGSGVNYVNLNGVTGIECPSRDCEAYANALVKLGEDGQLRREYGENARRRVLENFTQKQFKEKICSLVFNGDVN